MLNSVLMFIFLFRYETEIPHPSDAGGAVDQSGGDRFAVWCRGPGRQFRSATLHHLQ